MEILSLDIQAKYASVQAAQAALDKYNASVKAAAAADAAAKLGDKSSADDKRKAGELAAQAQLAQLAIKERADKAADRAAIAEQKAARIEEREAAKKRAEAEKTAKEAQRAADKKARSEQKQAAKEAKEADSEANEVLGKTVSLGTMVGNVYSKIAEYAMKAAAFTVQLTIDFAKFAIVSADAARTSALFAEASAGSTLAGAEEVAVVNQLATRLPVARDKIDELARSYLDARLQGRAMQAATAAVSIELAAIGQGGANALDAIVKQSAAMRRFYIGARDMRGEYASLNGTGLKAVDVYNAVAKTLGVSVAQAQQMVARGTVPLQKGLEALELAANNKLGNLASRQMIGLINLMQKGRENAAQLFAKVDLSRFLSQLAPIFDLLSAKTYTGYALQQVIGKLLTTIGDFAAGKLPLVRAALIGMAVGAIYATIGLIKLKDKIAEFDEATGLSKIGDDTDKIQWAANAGQAAFALMSYAIGTMVNQIDLAIKLIDKIKNVDLGDAGKQIIMSLVTGLLSGSPALQAAVATLASVIPDTLASKLVMHSPSVLITQQIRTGVGGAVVKGAQLSKPDAQRAGSELASSLMQGTGSIGQGAGPSIGGDMMLTIKIDIGDKIVKTARVAVLDMLTQSTGVVINAVD